MMAAAVVTPEPGYEYDDVAMPGIGYNNDRAALGLAVGLASEERRKSFANFPAGGATALREKLVAGHFVYTGPGDCAMCEDCGGKLHKWSPTDCPLAQHAKHFPNCPFIQTYQREIGLTFRALEMGGLDPESSEHQLCYLLGKRGVRDAKKTEYFKRGKNPLSTNRLPGAKPITEASASQSAGGRPQNPDFGIGPCLSRVNFRTDNRDVKSRMDLPIVRTMITEFGFKPEVIRSVIREKLSTTGDDFETPECLALAVMEHEKARAAIPYTVPPLPQRKSATRSGTGTSSSPDVVPPTWNDVAKARDRKRCKRCRQREATILLLPCSHMVLCKECLPGETTCPVKTCDREISHFIEVFIS